MTGAVHEGDLLGAVLLEVFHEDQLPDYAEDYGVTYEREGFAFHGWLYRFHGTHANLRRMVADCWQLRLTFPPTGDYVLRDPEVDDYCGACGEIMFPEEHPHEQTCPAREYPDNLDLEALTPEERYDLEARSVFGDPT